MTPRFRQARIAEILESGPAADQREIVSRLRASGIRISQATLSRDLREMGVVRAPQGYLLPQVLGAAVGPPGSAAAHAPPGGAPGVTADSMRIVREFARDLSRAANLVVVKTDPGHAHGLGVAVDHCGWPEAVGTVAGDDTIFIAAATEKKARLLLERIRKILN